MKKKSFLKVCEKKDCENLLLEFFSSFAKFEFSLKASGFLDSDSNGFAKVSWQKVKEEFKKSDKKPEEITRCLYAAGKHLWKNPPKKQMVEGERLKWKEEGAVVEDEVTVDKAITMIKRVRNNLFHGGKLWDKKPNIKRDMTLIKEALEILYILIKLDSAVCSKFHKNEFKYHNCQF